MNSSPKRVPWLAETIRVIAFRELSERRPEHIWKLFTGAEPQERSEQPAIGMLAETGEFEGAWMTTTQNMSRIDIAFGSHPATLTQDKPWYEIGAYWERQVALLPLIKGPLLQMGPFVRLAFAPVVISPTGSPEKATELLSQILKTVDINPSRDREVDFRINRPRQSNILGGLKLNRLFKWHSITQVTMGVNLTMHPQMKTSMGPSAVRVEGDVNTDETRTERLPEDKVAAIFDELVKIGNEVLEQGDVA